MTAQQEASVADRVDAIARIIGGHYNGWASALQCARQVAALWPAPVEDAESDLADAQLAISVLLRQARDRKTRIAALEKMLTQIVDAWASDAAMYPVLEAARVLLSTKEGE